MNGCPIWASRDVRCSRPHNESAGFRFVDVGGGCLTCRGRGEQHVATDADLDGDLRSCLYEFEKVLQPVLALTECGVLLGCFGDELGFHQRARYWAVTLVVQSLNDADKEGAGVLNVQRGHPVIL